MYCVEEMHVESGQHHGPIVRKELFAAPLAALHFIETELGIIISDRQRTVDEVNRDKSHGWLRGNRLVWMHLEE